MGNRCAWRLLLTLPENSWSLLNELPSLQAATAPLVVPWLNAERFTFPIARLIQNTLGEVRTSILSGRYSAVPTLKGNDLLGMIVIYRLEVSPRRQSVRRWRTALSTAFRILAGDDNFSDESILGKNSKVVMEHLAEVWIHRVR